MADPELFFKDQLSVRSQAAIPTVFKTAYAAAESLIQESPILQVESARDNKGRVITWSVDLAIKRAIETGAISCEYRWQPFAKPTGRYLELIFSHSTASISQVDDPHRQPRNVVFRENARLNSPDLLTPLESEAPVVGRPHFILVHGYQTLEFAHFGIPSSRSKRAWAWLSPDLMKLPHAVPFEGPEVEDTDIDFNEVGLLKDEIERWVKDNDE